jgi:hypothetical protein
MFWNHPVALGGLLKRPLKALPPSTWVSLQTSFFIACFGATEGPPVSLNPAADGTENSKPALLAKATLYRKLRRHCGLI